MMFSFVIFITHLPVNDWSVYIISFSVAVIASGWSHFNNPVHINWSGRGIIMTGAVISNRNKSWFCTNINVDVKLSLSRQTEQREG